MIALLALLALADGHAALARYECVRCHEIPDVAAASTERGCVQCHRAIHDGSIAQLGQVDPKALDAWRARIVHFVDVPSLTGLDRRVRRSWIEGFLAKPHDVRPNLPESMPRLPVTADDARAIAAAPVPHQPDALTAARVTSTLDGRALLEAKGCTVCHRFTGVEALAVRALPVALDGAALARGVRLAPDLRHVRARMTERSLLAWLADPRALKSDTAMPRIPLTTDEAQAIARYLLEAPLAPLEIARAPAAPLEHASGRVGWDEVNERVFKRSCRHCHADPGLAFGDGGPGNTGGFGYRGRGLSFASYEEINAGSTDDDGDARSIFAPLEHGPMKGVPRLVAHLRARRVEERGGVVEGIVGMPLALPALSDDDLHLLEAWIAQGRPR